jgi:hypothetical protein
MCGDLRDTMEQVRAHNLVNGISHGWRQAKGIWWIDSPT